MVVIKKGPKKGPKENFRKIFFYRYIPNYILGKVKKFQVVFVWTFFEKKGKNRRGGAESAPPSYKGLKEYI